MNLRLLALVFVTCFSACRESLAPQVPLEVTMEASHLTALAGDTITFIVHATGNNLVGVEIDFGDSVSEAYSTGGAHTARVTFRHAFVATGSFTVRAVVTDAIAGVKEATLGIQVN